MTNGSREIDIEEALKEAIAVGDPYDFAEGISDEDLDAMIDEDDPRIFTLDAELLRRRILDDSERPDPLGLTIRGARIDGDLEFAHASISYPVRFQRVIVEGRVNFSGSCFHHALELTDSLVRNDVVGDNAKLGSLDLSRTVVNGEREKDAVNLDLLDVAGNVHASGLTLRRGRLSAVGADVRGSFIAKDLKALSCWEPRRNHADCVSICADSLEVGGVLDFSGVRAGGDILARGMQVGGQFFLSNAQVGSRRGHDVKLNHSVLGKAAFLQGVHARSINADSAVFGFAEFSGVTLTADDDEISLSLDHVEVSDEIRLDGAQIPRWLMLRGARIRGHKSITAKLTPRAGGEEEPQEGRIGAIDMSGAEIGGDIELEVPITVRGSRAGGILARRTVVGGRFDLTCIPKIGEVLPKGAEKKVSLCAPGATFRHLVLGPTDVDPSTEERRVAGELDFTGATLQHLETAPGESGAIWPSISPTSSWTVDRTSGPIGENLAATRTLLDPYRWSAPSADGKDGRLWHRVASAVKNAAASMAAAWSKKGRYGQRLSLQPWMVLADAFDSAGRESDARRLRFSATDLLFQHRRNRFSRNIWRGITKYTIGHGYYSQIALAWLVALWGLSTLLVAMNQGAFTPVSVDAAYPSLIEPLFAMDVVLSPVGSGQAEAWTVTKDNLLIVALTVIKLASWAMLGMFVTGISGLLTRR